MSRNHRNGKPPGDPPEPDGGGGDPPPGGHGAPRPDGGRTENEHNGDGPGPGAPEGAGSEKRERPGAPKAGKVPDPEPDLGSWKEGEKAWAPRLAGMANDGRHLGYGSGSTFFRVDSAASRGNIHGHISGDVHQNYYVPGLGRPLALGHYGADDLERIRARYVVPDEAAGERIDELLAADHIVVLRAGARSGRRTTALYHLSGPPHAAPRRVSILTCGEDPEEIREQVENKENGPAFLLDATGRSWPRTLGEAGFRTAFGGFAEHDRRLVILVDEPSPAEALRTLLVEHRSPDPARQVVAHLADLLHRAGSAAPERAREILSRAQADPEHLVTSWVDAMRDPAEATLLATVLDLWDQGEVPSLAEEVREQRRLWLDRIAQEWLAPNQSEGSASDHGHVLAGAVLNRHPALHISEAAETWKEVVHGPRKNRGEAADQAFAEPMEQRLRHMRPVEEDGDVVLALSRPELGLALLHSAWHDHPRAQKFLVEWLARLCERPNAQLTVVVSAAQALAQLAGYALDTVLARTVERWGDGKVDTPVHCRWAAAWLLEKLVFNQAPRPEALEGCEPGDPRYRIVQRVARLLRDWADTDDLASPAVKVFPTRVKRWFIAMITYGTYAALVPPIREDAVTALGESARLGVQTRHWAQVMPIRELGEMLHRRSDHYSRVTRITAVNAYRVGLRSQVVRELVRWSQGRSADMILPACRTLLDLAAVRSDTDPGTGDGTRPVDGDPRHFDLLVWLVRDPEGLPREVRDQVGRLWVVALAHRDTEKEAWKRIFQWDLQAGPPVTLAEAPAPLAFDMRAYLTDLLEPIYKQEVLKRLWPRLDQYYLLRERIAPELSSPGPRGGDL